MKIVDSLLDFKKMKNSSAVTHAHLLSHPNIPSALRLLPSADASTEPDN